MVRLISSVFLGLSLIAINACSKGGTISKSSNNASTKSNSGSGTTSSGGVDLVCNQLATLAAQNNSYSLLSSNSTNGFGLVDNTPLTEFENAADNFVEETLDPHIQASPMGLGFQIVGDVQVRDYQLSIEGAQLCSNDLAVFERPNQPLLLKGNVPKVEGVGQEIFASIPNLVYPTESYAVSSVYSRLKLSGALSSPKTIKRCIIFENGGFTPALKVSFIVDHKPYFGLATPNGFGLVGSDPVRSAAPAFLEEANTTTTNTTTGTATIAVGGTGIATSGSSQTVFQTKVVNLSGLSTGGSLCSQNFVVLSLTGTSSNPTLQSAASSTTENFTFPQSDNRFFAATVYANAATHVNWLLSSGFLANWPGPQVAIVMNMTDNADTNNNGLNNSAVYYPNGNSLTDPPQIELGNGDGTLLQNLWSDPDAVQHETGHHMIYTRLTDISDSIAVVIHEGYADSQVLLQNQSPCLASTVCPTGSSVCLTSKCLRSAANNFTMAAPPCTPNGTVLAPQCLPVEVHQRSQVISGMLWDVAQVIGPSNGGYNIALQLEVRSITYFTADSEYGDMLEALIKADEDMGSKYQSILITEMCARGFDSIENTTGTGSWMSQLRQIPNFTYTCPAGSGAVPTGPLAPAPTTSGAYGISTTATGGQ